MFYQNQHFGISEYFCKESGENFSFPAHLHHSYEWISVLEGSMRVSVGEFTYELQAGEGVLIFPEQIHSLESTESKHVLVIFSPDIVRAYTAAHATEIPRDNRLQISDYIRDQLAALEETSSIIKKKAVLYAICGMLDEQTEYLKKRSGEDGLLRSVFDYVEKNYQKECTLQSLCNSLGYNGSYLSRYFGEATKTSFTDYVNRYRVSKACYLLRNTNRTVLECSYECGYGCLRSFNRNFKAILGVSPKEYRMGK